LTKKTIAFLLELQLERLQSLNQIRGSRMPNLTIVANITAKADKIDLVKAELEKLIDITRAEEGCIHYDLYQDNENPAHFLFYENWESRKLWQAHMGNQHLKDCMAATEGAVEGFTVNKMTKIA
jgi:quinol monooxygenase YgiN